MKFILPMIFIVTSGLDLFAQPGTLDLEFGADTYISTDFDNTRDIAYAVAIQDDGKFVLAGRSTQDGDKSFALVRYNTNGTIDSTFGDDGKVTKQLSGDEEAFSIVIQPDGKIIAAGAGDESGSGVEFMIARFKAGGERIKILEQTE